MPTVNQPSATPTRKVGGGLAGGSLVTVAVFALQQFGITVPGEVAAAAVTLLSFLVAYVVKERGA